MVAQTPVAGDWLLTEDIYGNPLHQRLTLKVDGTVLSGTLGRRPVDGTVSDTAIRFTLRNEDAIDEFNGLEWAYHSTDGEYKMAAYAIVGST